MWNGETKINTNLGRMTEFYSIDVDGDNKPDHVMYDPSKQEFYDAVGFKTKDHIVPVPIGTYAGLLESTIEMINNGETSCSSFSEMDRLFEIEGRNSYTQKNGKNYSNQEVFTKLGKKHYEVCK